MLLRLISRNLCNIRAHSVAETLFLRGAKRKKRKNKKYVFKKLNFFSSLLHHKYYEKKKKKKIKNLLICGTFELKKAKYVYCCVCRALPFIEGNASICYEFNKHLTLCRCCCLPWLVQKSNHRHNWLVQMCVRRRLSA